MDADNFVGDEQFVGDGRFLRDEHLGCSTLILQGEHGVTVLGRGLLIDDSDDADLSVECLGPADVHGPAEVVAFLDESLQAVESALEVLGEVVDLTFAGGFPRHIGTFYDGQVRSEFVLRFHFLL